ncbi:MAG: glycoside hydrolase domain-containing protein [Bacteroidota bacterium]
MITKKYRFFLSFLIIFLSGISGVEAQVQTGQLSAANVPVPVWHYQEEYTFDTTVNVAAWNNMPKGMQVSFASTDEHYFRSELPAVQIAKTWNGKGWIGERINTMVLVWSADTLEQVRFTLHDLKTAQGKRIAKENIQYNMVRYVISNYPYAAKDVTCGESPYKSLYLMPDRFEAFDRFQLPGKTVRPVWISIDIPAGTTPGEYKGIIEVQAQNATEKLTVSVQVQNQLLPKPSAWKHRLDLWQNPWVVAEQNNVKPWSPEHKLLLKKHLKLYADAGGKFITTYGVHSPWSDNSYRIEGNMIEWIKQANGKWLFDYTIFDDYVQLAMSVGISDAITMYTPVPWGFRFRYMNAATGNFENAEWAPDSEAFKTVMNVFLTDFKKHLQLKSWFNKTYIGINENAMEQTLAAIKVVKEHDPGWKITYAGDWHKELESLLDDYSYLYGKESGVDVVKNRSAKGFTTTYYVCCNPPVPNNFVFSPPVEGRWISWYTSAHGYDGFLRWAYDAWPADPMRDARHTLWPAGDCFLMYPGGNSCIRFEKMREGIVDFEKIKILKNKAGKSTDRRVKELLMQLEAHLQTLLVEKDFNTKKIVSDVYAGNELLDQLSEMLASTNSLKR